MKRKIKKFNNKQEFLENLINNALKLPEYGFNKDLFLKDVLNRFEVVES